MCGAVWLQTCGFRLGNLQLAPSVGYYSSYNLKKDLTMKKNVNQVIEGLKCQNILTKGFEIPRILTKSLERTKYSSKDHEMTTNAV